MRAQVRRATDLHRRASLVRVDARAHHLQRHRDALHRPAHQRLIADQRGIEALRREQPHHQAHRRAGIAHVERRRRGCETVHARAVQQHLGGCRALDAHAERPQRARRGEAVLAVEEAADVRVARGERAEHQRAVRDRLVARHGERAGDAAARGDPPACARERTHCTARGYEPSTRNSEARFLSAASARATCGSSACPSRSMKNT